MIWIVGIGAFFGGVIAGAFLMGFMIGSHRGDD